MRRPLGIRLLQGAQRMRAGPGTALEGKGVTALLDKECMRVSQQPKQERELAGSRAKSYKRKHSGKITVFPRQTNFQANCFKKKKKKKRAGSSWRRPVGELVWSLRAPLRRPLRDTPEKDTALNTYSLRATPLSQGSARQ